MADSKAIPTSGEDSGAPPPQPSQGDDMARHESRMDVQRKRFEVMPKVRIKTQEDEVVTVNGYGFHIQGKQRVEVPELVAEILEQSGRI